MATCSRPSAGETPSEMTLCESFVDNRCGSFTVLHEPDDCWRRAITAPRSAVYQAAYWKPA
jgi:hypothetical protein